MRLFSLRTFVRFETRSEGILYCVDWTGLDWTGLDWTCKTGTQDRLLLLIFSAFVNQIKLNGEQTFTKTNLRLKILFIYF